MAQFKIAAVLRAPAYSPNHIGNDAAILNMVADQLRKRGCEVTVYNEDQLIAGQVEQHVILNMCRESDSLSELQRREQAGDLVVNSAYGIENCIRERMARILTGNGLPYPQSLFVNTDEGVRDALRQAGIERCWIKRGDHYAKHKEDVTFVRHAEEAQEILHEYFMRGISRAVIIRHLEGRLIKYYGVRGTSFFYCFDPLTSGGTAIVNNDTSGAGLPCDPQQIRDYCNRAAEAVDVTIYGGDCIVANDGSITIVDLKDWPSFAPCRHAAAPVIAREVLRRIRACPTKNVNARAGNR